MRKFLCAAVLALAVLPAGARDTIITVQDAALDQHVMAISDQLRCLVCQNQTIADSHAELAIDLRNQVREQVQRGVPDQQVIDYMVQRYGDFVLYRPPVKSTTWLLWFGPFGLLIAALAALIWHLRRSERPATSATPDELAHAAQLLNPRNAGKEPV